MYTLIKLDEATLGFVEFDMPLYSIIYSCWRNEHALNVQEFVQLTQRMRGVSDDAWLQRKTSRSGLGREANGWRLDEVKRRCMTLIENYSSPELDIVQVSSDDEVFQLLQQSLVEEVDIGRHSLLFLFLSKPAANADRRIDWLSAGFVAQQLSVIAADAGLGSFSSHGYERPCTQTHGALDIEYIVWIG
ncbi:hypothetical protein CXQ81_14385 [Pseudomonas sp. 09C 129]|uniref:hypothetical protein n=1 Tax=Pseudomonas sp. 09C 129 TaxID=2054915 RepID=UPI000C6EEEB6|nr:hypothetical protein [Pseudomonas sp. 09C 129]AUG01744.1 hypothetical protein CXQ81_14385 [Pseudomonas sp. 09C 129]